MGVARQGEREWVLANVHRSGGLNKRLSRVTPSKCQARKAEHGARVVGHDGAGRVEMTGGVIECADTECEFTEPQVEPRHLFSRRPESGPRVVLGAKQQGAGMGRMTSDRGPSSRPRGDSWICARLVERAKNGVRGSVVAEFEGDLTHQRSRAGGRRVGGKQ